MGLVSSARRLLQRAHRVCMKENRAGIQINRNVSSVSRGKKQAKRQKIKNKQYRNVSAPQNLHFSTENSDSQLRYQHSYKSSDTHSRHSFWRRTQKNTSFSLSDTSEGAKQEQRAPKAASFVRAITRAPKASELCKSNHASAEGKRAL